MAKKKQPKSDGELAWRAVGQSVRGAANAVRAVNNILAAAASVKALLGGGK
jgi:hypothetical protein